MNFGLITRIAELVEIDSHCHDYASIREITWDGYNIRYRYCYYQGFITVR